MTGKPITQEHARRILANAIELDSGGFTTIQELEIIAREVGISAEAFHAAVSNDRPAVEGLRAAKPHMLWARAVVAVGMPLGFTAGWVLTHFPMFNVGMPMLGIMTAGLAASAALIALEKAEPVAHRFVFRNTMLWAGVAAGSLMAIAMAGGLLTRSK